MSAILALETSTPLGSVAVARGGEITFEKSFTSERSHNSRLFAPLREALESCSGSLRAIVVGTGPASYTGVRIGIAAAQGLALSRHVPVVGLASVLAVDFSRADFQVCCGTASTSGPQADLQIRSTSYHVCGDARRGAFFLAEVQHGKLLGDIATLDADGLRLRHSSSQRDIPWFTFDAKAPLQLEAVRCVSPSASQLALAASSLSDEELHQLAQKPLQPIYLSAPFVTMPQK